MRHQVSYRLIGLVLLALGCRGRLIEPNLPGQPGTPTSGTPSFAIRIGGTGTDLIKDMATDATGNVYVTGTFTGSVDFDPATTVHALSSLGGTDVFVAKYTAAGALAWVARIGGIGAETATSLARDPSGNLFVGGGFEGSTDFAGGGVLASQGGEDGFVAKFSTDGVLLWARRFGGASDDEVAGVATDGAGNVYAAGNFSGTANALPAAGPSIVSDGSALDGFVLALDPSGAVRWALPIGGTQDDLATNIVASSAGTITVGGTFGGTADFARNAAPMLLTSQGGTDIFLASYSSVGTLAWASAIGGAGDETLKPGGLALDLGGGAAIAGNFSGDVDFDPGPATVTRASQGPSDLFLARYDVNGNFLNVATLGGQGSATAGRIAADGFGNLLLTGAFSGSFDFDPSAGARILSSLGSGGATDVFVAKFSSGLSSIWAGQFGEVTSDGTHQDTGVALAADPAGNVFVAGAFFGSPDFDPGSGAFRLTSVGNPDGFIVLLTAGGALALQP